MAITHLQARAILVQAFREVMGREPSREEMQFAQATALYESNYGQARFSNHVTGESIGGTNNWGSVHCASNPPCPEGCFEATDTRRDRTKYLACFRRFVTPVDGARYYVQEYYKRRPSILAAAGEGDIQAVAAAITSRDPISNVGVYSEASPANIERALQKNLEIIAGALGEPLPRPKAGWVHGS